MSQSEKVGADEARYATARPLDRFARDFLRYLTNDSALSDDVYIQQSVNLGPIFGEFVRTVKVLSCTDRFWERLMDVNEKKMVTGSPNEYDVTLPRKYHDGLLLSPVGMHPVTRQRYWIPPEDREEWLRTMFSAQFAHEFAPYDALIFLYKPERWAKAFTRERNAPWMTQKDFEEAKAEDIEVASYRVCAHECLHLIEMVLGISMPTWNPAKDSDPVEKYFQRFVLSVTLAAFEERYIRHDGPRSDEVDL